MQSPPSSPWILRLSVIALLLSFELTATICKGATKQALRIKLSGTNTSKSLVFQASGEKSNTGKQDERAVWIAGKRVAARLVLSLLSRSGCVVVAVLAI